MHNTGAAGNCTCLVMLPYMPGKGFLIRREYIKSWSDRLTCSEEEEVYSILACADDHLFVWCER